MLLLQNTSKKFIVMLEVLRPNQQVFFQTRYPLFFSVHQ